MTDRPVAGRRLRPCLILAIGLSACALTCRHPRRLAVERVLVADTSASSRLVAAGVTRAAIAEAATTLLDKAPGFVPVRDAGRGTRRFRGQVLVGRADAMASGEGAAVVEVELSVELAPLDGGPVLREEGRAAEPITDGPQGLRSALEQATRASIERAVTAFSLQLAAEGKRTAELVRDLSSPEAAVRDHAVRVLADRGEPEAVPPLIARLRDPDPQVSERALGALAELRDQRAALALIDLTHHRGPAFTAQIAHILGDIGGADARAWLLTISAGHPDIAVRNAAREALTELDAREPRAATSGR